MAFDLQSVLGPIAGIGNTMGKKVGGGAPQPDGFKSFVGPLDGDALYDTAAEIFAIINAIPAANVFHTIWERTIPAQQKVSWGFGSPAMPSNQGYLWFFCLDNGAAWCEGTIRLVQMNHSRTRRLVVAELPTTQLHAVGAAPPVAGEGPLINKEEMIALPEKVEFPVVGEDSIIGIEMSRTEVATVGDGLDFRIPITLYQ